MIIENLKRILSEKETRLPPLRNQDLGTVKADTEKKKWLSTFISMENITDFT